MEPAAPILIITCCHARFKVLLSIEHCVAVYPEPVEEIAHFSVLIFYRLTSLFQNDQRKYYLGKIREVVQNYR
jgi:hypothetical protein